MRIAVAYLMPLSFRGGRLFMALGRPERFVNAVNNLNKVGFKLRQPGTDVPTGLSKDEYESLCRDYANKSSALQQSLVRLRQALERGTARLAKEKLDTLAMPAQLPALVEQILTMTRDRD